MREQRLRAAIRRGVIGLCVVLLTVAVIQVVTVPLAETHDGAVETIGGYADTRLLALPLLLFIVGGGGLLTALAWHPLRLPEHGTNNRYEGSGDESDR